MSSRGEFPEGIGSRSPLSFLRRSLGRLFFPQHCLSCERADTRVESWLCPECRPYLFLYSPDEVCPRCSLPYPHEGELCPACRGEAGTEGRYRVRFIAAAYEGTARTLVMAAKFGNILDAVNPFVENLLERIGERRYDTIVPIPSDHSLNGRLARCFRRRLGGEIVRAIRRRRTAPRQGTLSRIRRLENAERVLRLRSGRVSGMVLLVDDVTTTGATLDAAVRLLAREPAVVSTDIAVLAHTP
ncbi:MAG: ComF family protein [Candidatus Hydrogenedentota bacterium]|nr:MAG: ComF family protein [Candidatus Hydrogenedentota bacterium]